MTVFFQPFDGGTNGATVNWSSAEAVGSPISEYYAGTGSGKFTTSNPIRGTASAIVTTAAGQGTAQMSYGLPDGTTTIRGSVYYRVPTTLAADGQFLLQVDSSRAIHVVARADGRLALESWGTAIGSPSPTGTIPASGTIIRVALTVISGGTATAAVYLGHSTTPLWTATGPAGATGNLTQIQAGIPWTNTAAASLSIMMDDFRADTTGTGLLPPEVTPPSPTWVREPVGWRRLGTLDAVAERYVPPAGRGAAAPGQQTYPVPGGAMHVAPGGNDSTGTGTSAAPYATITKALATVAAGGTIVLRAGNHRLGYKPASAAAYSATDAWAGILADKTNLTIMGYPGEAAWIDGSAVHTGWTKVGAVWEKPLVLTHDRSPTGSYGANDNTTPGWQYVDPARPLAAWPERVWIDGRELTQVANRAAVTAGKFAVEGATGGTGSKLFTSSKYVLGDDPTGREVRVAEYATCLSSTGAGFVLKGVGVRRYAASVSQRGAVKLRHADCRIEHVTLEDCGTLAVTLFEAHRAVLADVTVRRVGLLGIEGTDSDDLIMERLLVTACNNRSFNHAPEAGGIKLLHMRRPTVRNATIHDIAATGLWLDESVSLAVVHTCDVHWCDNHGIHVELGGAATVTNCVVSAPGNDCVQVFNASGAVRLWNNTLSRPGRLAATGRCVSIVADDRAPLKAGSVGLDPRHGFPHPDGVDALTVDVTVKNNVLGPSLAQGFVWNEDWSTTKRAYTAFGIKSGSNVNVIRRGKPEWRWVLSNAGTADPTIVGTLTDMQSRGLETGSTVLTDDYAADVNGALTARALATRPTGQALPADVATILGVATGSTNLIGAVR